MNKPDYITCIFVKEGISSPQSSPLPEVKYHTIKSALDYINNLKSQGLSKFLIFGVPMIKDVELACTPKGIVVDFIKSAKNIFGDSITLIADVGLSPYSEDGHSTVLMKEKIDELESYNLASKLAIAFAKAGADFVAPCLSLKDQVKNIRNALDKKGLTSKRILAYSSKFSSSLYGPYRATIQSKLKSEDKKFYQTDYNNPEEALEQIKIDENQNADWVMVKPGLFYLDILYRARKITDLPLAVYHVSGEYVMIKAASEKQLINEQEVFDELHSAFARCGADLIIGYAPEHFIRWNSY